jgi:glycine betaine/proline transport system permease protein
MAGAAVGVGLVLLAATKIAQGLVANWAYQRQFARWRIDRSGPTGLRPSAALAGGALMLVIYPLMVYRFSARHVVKAIATFPTTRQIALGTARGIDSVVDWLTIHFVAFFDVITAAVRTILNFLELVFIGIPWPVMALLLLLIAWRAAGRAVAVFTAVALAYLGFFGFWEKSMSTISLVGASVLICFIAGTPFGIWCAKSARVDTIAKPILDFMQTIPSFVYLVPAIAFFSIGKPPGVLATVIFAMPPMIRLTTLGIRQVPDDVKEAALAFGASPRQLLVKIELPLAVPAIMTGINQTIMMSLSMVVVAALIGAGGLGYDVLFALQHVEAGRGILAGIAIALCAMIMDRIVQGSRPQGENR